MRPPATDTPLYWFCAGDILSRDPEAGARPLTLDTAARLHLFHTSEIDLAAAAASRASRDFHRARERELAAAIAAAYAWRRAAQA